MRIWADVMIVDCCELAAARGPILLAGSISGTLHDVVGFVNVFISFSLLWIFIQRFPKISYTLSYSRWFGCDKLARSVEWIDDSIPIKFQSRS